MAYIPKNTVINNNITIKEEKMETVILKLFKVYINQSLNNINNFFY